VENCPAAIASLPLFHFKDFKASINASHSNFKLNLQPADLYLIQQHAVGLITPLHDAIVASCRALFPRTTTSPISALWLLLLISHPFEAQLDCKQKAFRSFFCCTTNSDIKLGWKMFPTGEMTQFRSTKSECLHHA
jgi:hypothetical protein